MRILQSHIVRRERVSAAVAVEAASSYQQQVWQDSVMIVTHHSTLETVREQSNLHSVQLASVSALG